MKPRSSPWPLLAILLLGSFWAFLPVLRTTPGPRPTVIVSPRPEPFLEVTVEVQPVELIRKPQPAGQQMYKTNFTKPMDEWYFPPLPPSLYLRNLPCIGIRDWPIPPPKPLPPNPRFLLLIDSWERQQTGLKTVESACTIVERFGLVFVLPNVRMSNIQGIPGWTQWKSSHAMDGFTAAKYLLPLEEYFDLEFTRGQLPVITFEDYMELNNYTITTALMLDWEYDRCRNKPEWYPSYGARIQALQLQCFKAKFPSSKLTPAIIDKWLTMGEGEPIPEAAGRSPPKYPSVALLNWRKQALGSHDWADELWGGKCRFRWARKWNATAVAWQKEHLPDRYVALKIRSGNWLRHFWLPKKVEDVQRCFDHMAQAAKYYMKLMGLPEDAPVYLSTEWPNPPESRWSFKGVKILTASFNYLYKQLNMVTYRNRAYDIGIVTVISFNILINSAVMIAFEDTMTEFARMYNPRLPVVVVGTQLIRHCDRWHPPAADAPPHQFLYLVQGEKLYERVRYSDNSDTLCLTWGEPSDFCYYQPNTTWTSGRNFLWQKAVRLPRRYEYYIFLDDDTWMITGFKVERILLKWRPAIGVPGWAIHFPQPWLPPKNNSEALRITAWQGFITAFHQDVVFNSVLLPYYDGMDDFSWWTSQLYLTYLAGIFYPNETYGFQNIQAGSGGATSREYPRRWDLNAMNKPFTEQCIQDEAFRSKAWKGFVVEAEEVKEPLSPTRRHAMLNTTLRYYLSKNTPWWNRIRQLREEAFG